VFFIFKLRFLENRPSIYSQNNFLNQMSETVKIIFVTKGEKQQFEVPVGTTVLEAAHNNNIDLEGACEGSLACSTCHVIVDKEFYDKLSEASEDEEDMLDLAFGLTPTSRLGCQIIMTKELDGLTLVVPDETRNISIK
jgi:2Fe-2S ferredoxin